MKKLKQYIFKILGIDIEVQPMSKGKLGKLPLFIGETYHLFETCMLDNNFILVEKQNADELSILQTEKHFKIIRETFNSKVVLLLNDLASYNRKRLIEKGINFIIPDKQLFLPDMLIDLKESLSQHIDKAQKGTLLPSAQQLVLYRIINRKSTNKIEELSFKQLAVILGYTPMVITNAVEQLKSLDICTTIGEKEKHIRFNLEISEMWHDLEKRKLIASPVLKSVFVDELPKDVLMLQSNTTALPEYSDMNADRQLYFAIQNTAFYKLQKGKALINANESEGKYCLEVWKYDPHILAKELDNKGVVDPLSLFLCLKNNPDERIQGALEQIIDIYI